MNYLFQIARTRGEFIREVDPISTLQEGSQFHSYNFGKLVETVSQ